VPTSEMNDLVIPIQLYYTFDEIIYRKKGCGLGKQNIFALKCYRLADPKNTVFPSNRLNSKIK